MLEMFIPDAIIAGVDLLSNAVSGYVVPNSSDTTTTSVQKSFQDKKMEWNRLIEEMNDFKNSLNISKEEKSELVARTIQMVNFASKNNCTLTIKD